MIDPAHPHCTITIVDREDKALQRCTLSARSMPGDGQEHRLRPVLLPSPPSSGPKAKNLLNWGEAPTQVSGKDYPHAVGHMSTLVVLEPPVRRYQTWLSKALSVKHLRTVVPRSRPIRRRRATSAPQNGPCAMPPRRPGYGLRHLLGLPNRSVRWSRSPPTCGSY